MSTYRTLVVVAALVALALSAPRRDASASDVTPSAGPPGGDVTALLVVGGTLYAGTGANGATDSGGRIFKSSDDGATWTAADAGLFNVNIRNLTSHGGDLYAATSDGVFKSVDGGATWNRKINALTQTNTFGIGVTSSGDVYVGTNTAGVHKSTDGGDTWSPVNDGISNLRITSLVTDGDDVYAGTDGQSAGVAPEVYKTTDGGLGWNATAFPNIGNSVETLLVHDAILYAGVHQGGLNRTSNGGTSWEVADTGIPRQFPSEPATVVALAASGGTVYAGHFLGVAATTNNGDTWSDVSSGGFVEETSAVAPVGSRLIAGGTAGIWASDNGGVSWALSNTGLYASNIFSLHQLASGRILAGAHGSGLFLSDDGGRTWQLPNTRLENTSIRGLGATATDAFASDWANGILRSINGGLHWTYTLLSGAGHRSVVTVGSDVYVATTAGVQKTIDGGASWNLFNNGLSNTDVRDLAVDGTDLYAATGGGIFKSTNGGGLWVEKNGGLGVTNVQGITVTASGHLYVAIFAGGVSKSENGADSWTDVTSNLPNTLGQTIHASGEEVFVGLLQGGVFRSVDGGSSWIEVDLGRDYRGQAFLDVGDELFIGTDSTGVVYMPEPGAASSVAALVAVWALRGRRRLASET